MGVQSHDSGVRPLEHAILVRLFPGRSSGHLSTKTVLRTIDRLANEAGIQEVSPRQKLSRRKVTSHILMHSHVVNALMAGVPVPTIQIAG